MHERGPLDRWLIASIVAAAVVLGLCAWMMGTHPEPFHLRGAEGRLFRGVFHWTLIGAAAVGGAAALVLSTRRRCWWALVAVLIGLFAGALFVLEVLWLGGGFRT